MRNSMFATITTTMGMTMLSPATSDHDDSRDNDAIHISNISIISYAEKKHEKIKFVCLFSRSTLWLLQL